MGECGVGIDFDLGYELELMLDFGLCELVIINIIIGIVSL